MAKYETNFIPENTTPRNNDYIYVYNGTELEGKIKASSIKMPQLENKLYSFGALADVHVTHSALAMSKFEKALNYFNNVEKVKFIGIAGDLTSSGTVEQFASYREAVANYSDPNIPVYECTGNHDVEDTTVAPFTTLTSTQQYIGRDLYYSFEQGEDLFIMFGMRGWPGKTGEIFTEESLQWLYEILEANRNRRCFVFEHCPSMIVENGIIVEKSSSSSKLFDSSTSGAVAGWPPPTGNLLNQSSTSKPFRELMAHYKNVIWIHGHSHMEFHEQAQCSYLNYDRKFGCHSIHIPSLAQGRELNTAGTGFKHTDAESSGYVIDVYKNHIVLRGRDFVTDKFVPIATYCLDTTPVNIPEKSFSDTSGIIKT
jgi:predicted phosphodiesterase